MLGWFGQKQFSDVKINIICPATDVHIRKVSFIGDLLTIALIERIVHKTRTDPRTRNTCDVRACREALYTSVPTCPNPMVCQYSVVRRSKGLPTVRVRNILTGVSEQSKVLFQDSSFVLLPDMKWDLKTVQALYLIAIAKDENIRCLRDLTKVRVYRERMAV